MKAAILNGPGELQVLDKPRPQPAEGEVLVRVRFCGICGSDLHAFKTGMFPFGLTIGHEYAGTVEAVGPGVESRLCGSRVTGTASLACRTCFSCRAGRDNICEAMNVIGVTREGAMAEYVTVPAESLCPLPPEMPLEFGTLVEPMSVALHGAGLVGAGQEDTAVILGAGPLGLCTLAELKRRGLRQVYVVEINETRAKTAERMGADAVLHPVKENIESRLAQLTGGGAADLVFECAGLPETIQNAGNLVRQGGTVVVMGICEVPVDIFFLGLVTREIQLRTSYGSTAGEFRRTADLLAAREVDLSPIVSRRIPLEQVYRQGFAPLLESGSHDIKVLVECGDR